MKNIEFPFVERFQPSTLEEKLERLANKCESIAVSEGSHLAKEGIPDTSLWQDLRYQVEDGPIKITFDAWCDGSYNLELEVTGRTLFSYSRYEDTNPWKRENYTYISGAWENIIEQLWQKLPSECLD